LAAYRLTVRHGSNVERESFETVDDAVAALEQRAEAVRREGPLQEVSALRDFEPSKQVHARLELSTGGLVGGREVGIDVMGDGGLVPYVGVIRKRRLEPSQDRSAFDAVREALTG
jgi:hypothetical protein